MDDRGMETLDTTTRPIPGHFPPPPEPPPPPPEPPRPPRHPHRVPLGAAVPIPGPAPARPGESKWTGLYQTVRVNSEVPEATAIPVDPERPAQQEHAIRRALRLRARQEGLNLHMVRDGTHLLLWLTLPPPPEETPG